MVVISLLLTLLAAGGAAQWSGIVSMENRQNKKNSGKVTTQSFDPGAPSKEYIYSGGRLVATEEPISSCTYSIDPAGASFTSTPAEPEL